MPDQALYIALNSLGVQFLIILNIRIKEDSEEKPERSATSVTDISGSISIFSASAILF